MGCAALPPVPIVHTAADWASLNPILPNKIFGLDTTNHIIKCGDGTTAWSGLPSYSGGGMAWTEVTGTTQQMASANGYISNNTSLVVLTLPATAAVGDIIELAGSGSGGWKIAQNSGQSIKMCSQTTTTGATGYVASNTRYDAVRLICITANTVFTIIDVMGNITLS